MSIKFITDLVFDIYIKKQLIKNVDFSIKADIEKYLKKVFKVLKDKYDLKIEGFYNITIYIDKYYGIILHLEKENIDYYEYYKNQVDMRLITIETSFLYEVDDIQINLLDKVEILNKNNKIYLKIIKQLNELEMMHLLENSKIVYK